MRTVGELSAAEPPPPAETPPRVDLPPAANCRETFSMSSSASLVSGQSLRVLGSLLERVEVVIRCAEVAIGAGGGEERAIVRRGHRSAGVRFPDTCIACCGATARLQRAVRLLGFRNKRASLVVFTGRPRCGDVQPAAGH